MSACIYPFEDWGEEFTRALDAPIKYLPAGWLDRISLDPPPAEVDECALLAEIIKDRPAHHTNIVTQAQSRVAAIQPVLTLAHLYKAPVKARTIALVFAVLDEVLAPTFILKKAFRRGRPRQCCEQDMAPMFRGTPLDPLHPAYPSGHSTQAHAVAQVLALCLPSMAADFVQAADGVARNREIAGLHYPSDSRCGAELARQLVDLLRASPAFVKDFIAPALAEWP